MIGWLDISEYASKYGVSESTLRRRIRAKSVEHKMERGKYLLQDSPAILESAPLYARSTREEPPQKVSPQTTASTRVSQTVKAVELTIGKAQQALEEFLKDEEPILVRLRQHHNSVLAENRRLKEHISELETLVKALEAQLHHL